MFPDSNQVTLRGRGGDDTQMKTYSFDGAFGPNATQSDVYSHGERCR